MTLYFPLGCKEWWWPLVPNSRGLCPRLQVSRLEGQVLRYRTAAENAEKVEDELKAEKRKLQREVLLSVPPGTRSSGQPGASSLTRPHLQ